MRLPYNTSPGLFDDRPIGRRGGVQICKEEVEKGSLGDIGDAGKFESGNGVVFSRARDRLLIFGERNHHCVLVRKVAYHLGSLRISISKLPSMLICSTIRRCMRCQRNILIKKPLALSIAVEGTS